MNASSSERDIEKLYKWIDTYSITRQKRNINRDFSDAIPLVEMLKVHFPKVVDMHNYTPSNSFAQKVDNWRTLQRKVLSRKLKISFPQSVLDAVSKAEAGVVEEVLWQIKMAIDKLDWTVKNQESEVYLVEGFGNEIADTVMPIKIKHGSKILDQRIVPASVYDEMVESIKTKDDTIKRLQDKIYHLEQMVELKDSRIEDLRSKMNEENGVQSAKRFLNNLF
ncbi:sperm flagellar protein 1-like isoform X2 [Atheta coriaria]|uniref:sperm flagellar protein 1-like isoform X2 n=1 Tax=Dalotia coriaria TaxID=877792 RepID=UPI0031F433AC